ncbi:alkaline phosphatase D family protein [Asticcacaulis sp. MM231]|uniref:alkaline phosphatase D family protein n=1 Tax=Asticcacaulis sp. MM231 TaxID=3157666 RepID=UPI0032D57515
MGMVSRRKVMFAVGTVAAVPALGASALPETPSQVRFEHGVASGDPLIDGFILWTRISGLERGANIAWQIARDDSFNTVVAEGKVYTDAGRDYTVKADVRGLTPDTDYVYRFLAGPIPSPVGRTRTLPLETDKVVLAVASCALHPNGYFNAYRAIADLPRVDAVVHLGDYIYEYGAGLTDYGMGNGRMLMRLPEPAHEIVTLADYRMRHAQYKRDEDLQAAHARAPWICVFDDHEICNNPWRDGAENHNAGEGDWGVRKAAALKAYSEWMPIRDPEPGRLREAIYRSVRFGKLAELVMLESRLLARTKQLDYAEDLTYIDGKPDKTAFRAKLNAPERELLGAEQRQWLQNTLTASVHDGVTWQVLGNQIVMAKVNGPDIVKRLGPDAIAALRNLTPEGARQKLDTFVALFDSADPLPLNLDGWDGYPAERERVYAMIKAAQARTVVVSGDSHCAWANQLHDVTGQTMAVELGVTAISSPTRWLNSWLPDLQLAETLADQNTEVVAADDAYNGFVRLTLTPDEMTGEWMSVSTITSRTFTCFPQRRFSAKAKDLLLKPGA